MKRILAIYLLLMLVACNNKPSTGEQVDSTTAATNIYKEDSAVVFTEPTDEWLRKTMQQPATPQLRLEEYWYNDSSLVTPFSPDEYFFKNYRSILRWSPDSALVLDIGSYGTVLTTAANGEVKVEAGEPDTELALIDVQKNQRIRLMFVGPSSEILDAKWTSTKEALVVGTFDRGSGSKDTLLWMMDLQKNFFRLYNLKSHR